MNKSCHYIFMQPINFRYFDAHVHLLDYQQDILSEIIDEAVEAGVKCVVCNVTDETQYQKLEKLTQNTGQKIKILKSFGIHPFKVSETQQGWENRLLQKLKEDQNNLVGEIGLDFRKQIMEKNLKQDQMMFFDKQVKLACALNRPMSVHCVRAYGQILKYFKKLAASQQSHPNIVMHSYGGSKEITQSLLKLSPKLNIYFSLCQKRHEDLLQVIPVNRLLFQTDSPYQLDVNNNGGEKPKRENQNELKFIRSNSTMHTKYNMEKGAFLNEIWKNSLKAFKLLL